MAVKALQVKFNKAAGVDQALKAPLGTAEDIFNFRKHQQTGWICDRGIEPWWDPSPSFQAGPEITNNVIDTLLGGKVDSLFVWKKQSNNQVYTNNNSHIHNTINSARKISNTYINSNNNIKNITIKQSLKYKY
jgi:hypothetical protein